MNHVTIPITNQYMFNRVMIDKSICKRFLECVLGKRIDELEYRNAEQAIEPRIDAKGVRLDLFARSEGRVFDIELQVQPREMLAKRYRYYQAAIDTISLEKGAEYDELPESYIIFVCNHDPFGHELPRYTMEMRCREDDSVAVNDEAHWLALNCKAYAQIEDAQLAGLLEYISTGTIDPQNRLVTSIADEVERLNDDRKWVDKVFSVSTIDEDLKREARIMQRQAIKRGLAEGREEGLKAGRAEGRAEGLAEGHAEGLAEGLAEGIRETEQRYKKLVGLLSAEGRTDDIVRAFEDDSFRAQLFEEFDI